MSSRSLLACFTLVAAAATGSAAASAPPAGSSSAGIVASAPGAAGAPNVVTDWSLYAQQAIHGPAAPRPPASSEVLHALAALAMYDAAVAVEGGYEPFAAAIDAPAGADLRAAVATAAYLALRGRIAPVHVAQLDARYAEYLAGIADGPAKADGIAVGEKAAAAILARRAKDGFETRVGYACSATPVPAGEFEPDTGCPSDPASPQPVDVKLSRVLPYTFAEPSAFAVGGPGPLDAPDYARDFAETRDLGRASSTLRTPEQTDIAYFWSEHAYVHWNRNLIALAVAKNLGAVETARLFALAHTAAADAVLAGFRAKYHYRAWRPRTAIPRADTDGNPDTQAEPDWKPLLSVNHPEYPSAHAFWSSALLAGIAAHFGTTEIDWTISTSKAAVPQLVRTERTYGDLNTLLGEIGDARVYAGLHWRHSIRRGEQIGRTVAAYVSRHFFRPTAPF